MWPKAFAQLVELAPHISRLLPMADRFFQSKTAAEDSQRKAIDSLGEDLRAELREFTAAQTQQIAHLGAVTQRLERVANDAQAARFAAESLDGRLARIEARQSRLLVFLLLTFVLTVVLLVLLVLAVVHIR